MPKCPCNPNDIKCYYKYCYNNRNSKQIKKNIIKPIVNTTSMVNLGCI